MNRLALLVLVALLVGSAAQASTWRKACQDTGAEATAHSLNQGDMACSTLLDATGAAGEDTGRLVVNSCENIDILFFPDFDSDAAASGATIQVRSCAPGAVLGTDGCWAMENLTLDGVPSTNTEAIYGIAASDLFVDVIAYATPTEPVRVVVRCNGPR